MVVGRVGRDRVRDPEGDGGPDVRRPDVHVQRRSGRDRRGAGRRLPRVGKTQHVARRGTPRGRPFREGCAPDGGRRAPRPRHGDEPHPRRHDAVDVDGVVASMAQPRGGEDRRAPDGLRLAVPLPDDPRELDLVRRQRLPVVVRVAAHTAAQSDAGERLAGRGLDVLAVLVDGKRPRDPRGRR